jgi:hypothetical protein
MNRGTELIRYVGSAAREIAKRPRSGRRRLFTSPAVWRRLNVAATLLFRERLRIALMSMERARAWYRSPHRSVGQYFPNLSFKSS